MHREQVKWASGLARLGWAAKGIVYMVIGALTSLAAFGMGGKIAGKNDAFQWIIQLPLGKALLAVVAVGLVSYVVWRLIQAFADPEKNGSDVKGIFKRIGYAASGIAYAALAVYAGRLALNGPRGSGEEGEGDTRQFIVAKILQQPGGEWIVAVIALVFIGIGINQVYRAITNKFKKHVDLGRMNNKQRNGFMAAGKIGYIARGIVIAIIGSLFIQAAMHSDPSEAQGTEGAFQFLQNSGYGPWLLGSVALGLLAYGVFCLVMAKYQVIRTGG